MGYILFVSSLTILAVIGRNIDVIAVLLVISVSSAVIVDSARTTLHLGHPPMKFKLSPIY